MSQSYGQAISTIDSIKSKIEEKRSADSTRAALLKIEIENQRDSIAAVIKQRQEDRIERQDSIREARQNRRAAELENKREFLNRKKERAHIRDSVQQESERAAAARKAYRKSLKKNQKREKKTDNTPPEVVEKKARAIPTTKKKKEKPPQERNHQKENLIKEDSQKKKDDYANDETENSKQEEVEQAAKQKELVKQDKQRIDSINKKERKSSYDNDNRESIAITKELFVGTNPVRIRIFREPPTKKTTYFGFQFGSSNYLGDLGGNSRVADNLWGDINFKENTFFYGFALSHLRREVIGLRLSYIFGTVAGSDKNTYFQSVDDPSYDRYVRNLDFKSKISEGSLMLEVHPFKFFSYQKKLHNSYLQPYILVGIGNYTFNPQGSFYDEILDDDIWIDLQPLSLEGQGMAEFPNRKPYKLSQWNIPFGMGFNYEISPSILVGLEYVGRKLFTDYLDDVSTTYIDPALFDAYLTPEKAELARNLNNKSKLIDANKAYTVGDKRGNADDDDFYFSVSARLVIKLNKNRQKSNKKARGSSFYRYDDSEICD